MTQMCDLVAETFSPSQLGGTAVFNWTRSVVEISKAPSGGAKDGRQEGFGNRRSPTGVARLQNPGRVRDFINDPLIYPSRYSLGALDSIAIDEAVREARRALPSSGRSSNRVQGVFFVCWGFFLFQIIPEGKKNK